MIVFVDIWGVWMMFEGFVVVDKVSFEVMGFFGKGVGVMGYCVLVFCFWSGLDVVVFWWVVFVMWNRGDVGDWVDF